MSAPQGGVEPPNDNEVKLIKPFAAIRFAAYLRNIVPLLASRSLGAYLYE